MARGNTRLTITAEGLQSDIFLRRVEGVFLALLTFPYVLMVSGVAIKWMTTAELLKFDVGQWFAMGGLWGLLSLWWLIIRIRPDTAPLIRRVPLAIAIGIILGVTYLVQLVYFDLRRRPFDPSAHWVLFVFCAVPLAIMFDRLRVLWCYRNSENRRNVEFARRPNSQP
jgi:hypothetical protein